MAEGAGIQGTEGSGSRGAASPFSAPQINLPKGGGAIRGIDEKFAANPVTGTGSFTVPIAVSPGRFGFGPQLSLTYDSGGGNGIFGMGWDLSRPSITRRTDKGVPRYYDSEESDIFILSGAEDLVPVLLQNTKGRWLFDEFVREGHRVKRYRPRVEGLFARIERWTCLDSGEVHWRSISKDNILTVYGFDSGSRIADPENPNHVFSWLICRSYDDKGNAIIYDYAGENNDCVDLTKPNEQNRIRSANRYLKRIRYGNRVPLLLDPDNPSFRRCHIEPHDLDAVQWMFDVVFDYGEGHYREEPPDKEGRILAHAGTEAVRDWPVRRDPFSSYRSGFEIRTYRLCRRVLMFHHFSEELGTESYLVRSTSFHYHEKPLGSFITQVVQSGHKLLEDGRYLTRSLPPLDLSYTASPLEDPDFEDYRLEEVDQDRANLPGGIDGGTYRWLDLDGEGISGVLTEQGDAWFYKPNLGGGRFGATEAVKTRPSLAALSSGTQLLMDVGGDGNLDLVDLSPSTAGFQERTLDGGWEGFRAFRSLPVRDWSDPNLRFVDLTGDGVADILITEDDALMWHPSLLKEGFGPGLRVRIPTEEEKGPRVVFDDGTQSIYLADMSGDGLSDILRIRNGEICYWPNFGYGRFGSKITMDNAPRFDEPDLFDQVRLADTDGSGTSDIVYLGKDGVRIFLNETGNGWSHARHLRRFPAVDDASSVTVTDFLGRGTACLLWSSPLPREAGRQLRYVDLMCGQKPGLLTRVVNNLGAATRIEYASSTEFYLADKTAGAPWVTKLPFPVHVVTRVETYDCVSRNRFVARYTYHHGYYDGVEREFRGFGRIDQIDTEEFATLTESGNFPVAENVDAASNVPPVLTKTWFHTGIYLRGEAISRHLAHEYYLEGEGLGGRSRLTSEQIRAMLLDDTVLSKELTAEEVREACRSLKGVTLRQEVYALDGSEQSKRPYSVAEANFTIQVLQRRGINRHAVFFTHPRESLRFNYERKLYEIDGCLRADPRVGHAFTFEVDGYGNVVKSAAVGYGRRFADPSPLLTDADRYNQSQILVTVTENDYTNVVDEPDAYRTPLPAEARLYELVKTRPRSAVYGITNLFRFHELAEDAALASDGAHELPPEDWRATRAVGEVPHRRLLKQRRSLYRSDRLDRLLSPRAAQALALPGENYELVFTSGMLAAIYKRNPPDCAPEALLPDAAAVLASRGADGGAYVDLDSDGRWWAPSGRVFFSKDSDGDPARERDEAVRHFFVPRQSKDVFGHCTTTDYDAHDLVATHTVDPAGNSVRAEHNYRTLQPRLVTDPNGNRSAAAFDAFGLVVGTAVMGKAAENVGDSLDGFRADLTRAEIDQFFANPKGEATAAVLGRATARIVYDQHRFHRTKSGNPNSPNRWQPSFGATLSRETHDSDMAPGQQSKIQVSFGFSDGFGREIQKKIQAEPGPVATDGAVVNPRWVGNGWTIFNNKGKPVRQYEPFFDETHDFRFGNKIGVSPIVFYDPLGRVVASVHPNRSWQKISFDPWWKETWDVNDTVLVANPAKDATVADFFRRLPETDFLPTWYKTRVSGALGENDRDAADKASVHANTPLVGFSDSLGRTFMTCVHNRFKRGDQPPVDEFYATRVTADIEGNPREAIDAKGRVVERYNYDLRGNRVHQASMEAGERWTLSDVSGKPIRAWDSRGNRIRTAYDTLRRPTDLYLVECERGEMTVGRVVYGETRSDPETNNLRGKVVQVFDQAGVVNSDCYDFKNNLLKGQRQLAREYKKTLDWSSTVPLDEAYYANATRYDALNRPTAAIAPDKSIIVPHYNDANLLKGVDVHLRGADVATPFVRNLEYDAKGQRLLIEYGNGVRTSYGYDPLTFRLVHLLTRRRRSAFPGDCPQPRPSAWPGCELQNLHYTYDPKGNITHIRDDAQQTIYFRNRRVEPSSEYTYDAIYRLIAATGREHLGQIDSRSVAYSDNDGPRVDLPQPGDGNVMARYVEHYVYDAVGNILALQHRGADPAQPGWTRIYSYCEPSQLEVEQTNNRLSRAEVGETIESYRYDGAAGLHGNITAMPHLPFIKWDFRDQLRGTARQVVKDGTPETTWYVYDAAGQRVRKVTERQASLEQTPRRSRERLYIGSFEVFREYEGGDDVIGLEYETLHIMDDRQRIALVETCTHGNNDLQGQLVRYQFGNQLDSACLELDDQAQIISYEEYAPYGSSTYQAVRNRTETPKRYRYIGKERDIESGFYYHGARYYVPWLARWASCDPAGIPANPNLFVYASNNPINRRDATGLDDEDSGWISRNIGPASPFGQWLSHGDYVGSSFLQDDKKLETAMYVAGGVAIAAGTVATGGALLAAGGTAAGGTAVVGTTAAVVGGTEAAVGTTAAVVGGTELAVGTTAAVVGGTEAAVTTTAAVVGGTEAAIGTTAAVVGGTEAAVGTTAAVVGGTEATVGTTAVVVGGSEAAVGTTTAVVGGTEAAVGTTAAATTGATATGTGLTTAQLAGTGTAVAGAAATPQGQQILNEAGEVLESAAPALEGEVQAVSQGVQSTASQLANLNFTSNFTPQEAQAAQIAKNVFANAGSDPQAASRAGTAFHQGMGAAARGLDLARGPLQIELKTHWGQFIDQPMLDKATEQSLRYSQQFQAETGLVPIRMVVHYFLNSAFGESVKTVTH
jgi:RHS repeat-associated protein